MQNPDAVVKKTLIALQQTLAKRIGPTWNWSDGRVELLDVVEQILPLLPPLLSLVERLTPARIGVAQCCAERSEMKNERTKRTKRIRIEWVSLVE